MKYKTEFSFFSKALGIDYILTINTYEKVCELLDTKILTEDDFNFLPKEQRKKQLALHKIQNLEKLFNGAWVKNFNDPNQRKWFPYFTKKAGGWSFNYSCYNYDSSIARVGFYQNEEISNHVGKSFLSIYIDILD